MKKLLIVLCVCLVASVAQAQLWVEGQYNYISYDNSTLSSSTTQEKILVGWKWVYLWGSMDNENSIDYGGQGGVDFTVPGLGVGVRIPLVQYLTAYLEGGYFKPNLQGGWFEGVTPTNESMNIYGWGKTNGGYGYPYWKYTKMEVYDGFGGEVGLALDYPLIWGINLTAKTGYRYLKLEQHLWGVNDKADTGVSGWAFSDQLDLSGMIMGVGLKYEF